MIDSSALAKSRQQAVAYIGSAQLAGGNFQSGASRQSNDFTGSLLYETTFFTSLITEALSSLTEAKPVVDKANDYLLSQRSNNRTWNYWDRASSAAQQQKYPDDLDDTFCALNALAACRPEIITGEVLGHVAKLLIHQETQPGGPYLTWLVKAQPGEIWYDVDLSVNANIIRFLSRQGVTVQPAIDYWAEALRSDKLQSPYYPSPEPLLYFASAWQDSGLEPDLARAWLKLRRQGYWRNCSQTAMACTSLMRLGQPADDLQPAIQWLLSRQAGDGSWPAEAFSYDPDIAGQKYYAGCAALTTALCLEALQLYADKTAAPRTAAPSNGFYQKVHSSVLSVIEGLPHAELRHDLSSIHQRITRQDDDQQIVMLPQVITAATGRPIGSAGTSRLAAASLWGWMAYTTYDDVIDEQTNLHLIPAANFCLRQLSLCLAGTLQDNPQFQEEVGLIMNRLEAANA